ncbi:MAG: beta-ketoacyl-[acyl-carrier-protein] synthase family protein [Rhizobiales bacterium]|nr:beta-ketoacyl-[acyl-carrier-protein] synthase family protein [Hyphomicrobiales bacterium]
MSNQQTRRVVVTGTGVVSSLGIGTDKFWSSIKNHECGIEDAKTYDTEDLQIKIAGEVKNFDPKEEGLPKQFLMADRYSQFAGLAAREAVKQSGIEMPLSPEKGLRAAAIIGSGVGGINTLEDSYRGLFELKKRATHPLTLLKTIGSSGPAHISIEYGIKGPCFGVVSACSTATHSIGLVYNMIKSGMVDFGLGGAAEASLAWGTTRAWQGMRVLSPVGLYPFSKRRNGTVLAEGSGILMLEEYEHAKERGATILAEVKGFGMTADAADMVNPDIDGTAGAMELALKDADLAPSDIDYINAHGTATVVNDINETRSIKRVFGNSAKDTPISSTKSMHGHALGAGGGIEAIACLKAMQDNYLPATIGFDEPGDECDLDYIPNEGRSAEVNYTMSNSFAFGGLNAVLVFGPSPA